MSIPPLHLFLDACHDGDLEMAKGAMRRLQGSHDVDICHIAFLYACGKGHVHVAQWLMTLDWDWREDLNGHYAHACGCGQLAIARMLLALGGVDVHANHDAAFRGACANPWAHHVARWLIRLDPDGVWWDTALDRLQQWSGPRDAWMRSVVHISGSVDE
jgi:hypothetical protein